VAYSQKMKNISKPKNYLKSEKYPKQWIILKNDKIYKNSENRKISDIEKDCKWKEKFPRIMKKISRMKIFPEGDVQKM